MLNIRNSFSLYIIKSLRKKSTIIKEILDELIIIRKINVKILYILYNILIR